MIALVTINISLIEGLSAQILFWFKISVLRSRVWLFFFGRENMSKTKRIESMTSCLLAYIYACVLCTHIRIHTCRDLVHLDSAGTPGVSSRPWAHIWSPCVQLRGSCTIFSDSSVNLAQLVVARHFRRKNNSQVPESILADTRQLKFILIWDNKSSSKGSKICFW